MQSIYTQIKTPNFYYCHMSISKKSPEQRVIDTDNQSRDA